MPNEDVVNTHLKQLAQDLLDGKVFTSQQIKSARLLPMIFQPLSHMSKQQIEEMRDKGTTLLYEYKDKATSGKDSNTPCFSSMHSLTRDRHRRLIEYYKELKASRDSNTDKPKG